MRTLRPIAVLLLALLCLTGALPASAHEGDPRIVTEVDEVVPALPPEVVVQVQAGIATQLVADDVARNNGQAVKQEMAARGAERAAAAKAQQGSQGKGKKKGQKDGKGGNGEAAVAAAAGAPAVRPVAAVAVDSELRASSTPWTSPLPLAALALSPLVGTALYLRRRAATR